MAIAVGCNDNSLVSGGYGKIRRGQLQQRTQLNTGIKFPSDVHAFNTASIGKGCCPEPAAGRAFQRYPQRFLKCFRRKGEGIGKMCRILFTRAFYCLQIGKLCSPNRRRILGAAAGAGEVGGLNQFSLIGQHIAGGCIHRRADFAHILYRPPLEQILFLRQIRLAAGGLGTDTAVCVLAAGLVGFAGVGSGRH